MPPKRIRRGFDPDDGRLFSPGSLEVLKRACREVEFLLDRGYPKDSAIGFAGSHHQLTVRQRLALHRAAASPGQVIKRRANTLPGTEVQDRSLLIDGFNLIITLEVALSGSPLILGSDGALRDMAGLRGTYRLIPQTGEALGLICRCLQSLSPAEVLFYLDASVSNSGRLRSLILERAEGWGRPVQVHLVPDADQALFGQSGVVTSDSVVLDRCKSWLNMAVWIVREFIPEAWIIDMTG